MQPFAIRRRTWLLAFSSLGLTACGFRFRGDMQLPFDSIYIEAGEYNSFSAELKRFLASGNKTRVVEDRKLAQVVLQVLGETLQKQILSLSAGGKVREFELLYLIRFRLTGQDKQDWIAPSDVSLRRDYTFDDQAQLAKESEEASLVRDMKNDALHMILRRLSKAKPPAAS